MSDKALYACMSCGSSGKASTQRRWSITLAIVLLLFGFFPGILYILVCIILKKKIPICPICKRATLVPAGSPQGIRIAEQFSKATQAPPAP